MSGETAEAYEKRVADESGKLVLKMESLGAEEGLEAAMAACNASGFFISGAPYNNDNVDVAYDIPEGARWLRVGRGKIRFYTNNMPEITTTCKDRRREYHEIPEGAKKVKRIHCVQKGFEWMGPGNAWICLPEAPEGAIRASIESGAVKWLVPGEKKGSYAWKS
jgi:hypothetical protein